MTNFRVGFSSWISSWIFELDFDLDFELDFELDFRVRISGCRMARYTLTDLILPLWSKVTGVCFLLLFIRILNKNFSK